MTRRIVLAIAALIVVLTLHPWTWAARGMREILVPACVLAIVAVVLCIVAIRLGDLRLPSRARPRPRPVQRGTASEATRAAEELLRRSKRR